MTEQRRSYGDIRILMLEDEIHTRTMIRRLLRQIGFEQIHEGINGIEGFQELLRVKPDIILCDIHMDGMDGMKFLEKLRNLGHPAFASIPLIFLTADRQSSTVSAAVELNVDGYLAKPVSFNSLKERLDAVLFGSHE